MTYVAPSTVVAGQTYSASAHNVIVNDVIDHESRIVTAESAINLIGLDLIYSTTLTTGSTFTTPAVFSATYDNYVITVDSLSGAATAYINFLKTSDNTVVGSWYAAGWVSSTPSGIAGSNISYSNTATSSPNYINQAPGFAVIRVFNPFNSARTMFDEFATIFGNVARSYNMFAAGTDTQTSIHKISVVSTSGNFTAGNVKIYGMKK